MDIYGFNYFPNYFSRCEQEHLRDEIRMIATKAPLFTPIMPVSGQKMSVRMTNCGPLGWVTDQAQGYRYQAHHPVTGESWPQIPNILSLLWQKIANFPAPPEACLINYYNSDARMGMHQDKDEKELNAPVVSVSLGESCLFRIGGRERSDKTHSVRLNSGDIIVFGGKARLAFHGVDRIYPNTSTLLKSGGRINVTLRRVTPIASPNYVDN